MKSFGELEPIDWYAICAFIGCIVMIIGTLGYVGILPGGGIMLFVFAVGLLVTASFCIGFYRERRRIVNGPEA